MITGIAVLLLVPLAAHAADLRVKAPPLRGTARAFSWTGCHVGGNFGGHWADTSGSVDIAAATGAGGPSPASTFVLGGSTTSTDIGGAQLGCDYQMDAYVFGIEGDAEWGRWNTTRTVGAGAPPNFVAGDNFSVSSNWENSIRGRVGYAWDRWLLYATGGAAWTTVRANTNFIAVFAGGILFPAATFSDTAILTGGTVGGGLEYALWNNLILGVEGRYTWYGTHTFNGGSLATFGLPGAFTFAPSATSIKLNTSQVLGRVSWKF